jgi:predicted Zn-dependent protease
MRGLKLTVLQAAFCAGLVAFAPMGVRAAGDVGKDMESQYGVIDSSTANGKALNDELMEIVSKVVEGVNKDHGTTGFQLKSVTLLGGKSAEKDKVVNAFALPDGRIYVTLGLLQAIQNEPLRRDGLAFVVGHEITHVVEKHSVGQQKKAVPALIGAAVLGALSKNPTAQGAAGTAATAYVSHFGREDEYRADRGGLVGMHYAGFDPAGAVMLLGVLQRVGGSQNKTTNGWFGSHPITQNRLDRVNRMIADIQAGRPISDGKK